MPSRHQFRGVVDLAFLCKKVAVQSALSVAHKLLNSKGTWTVNLLVAHNIFNLIFISIQSEMLDRLLC